MDTVSAIMPGTSAQTLSTNKAQEQKSQFLKLLVAQLKGQNPLDPQDGAAFVSQLAQFSSLEELINIRTAIESFQKNSTTTANPLVE
jgi:flagellar basal-body rod modification protein FlgD